MISDNVAASSTSEGEAKQLKPHASVGVVGLVVVVVGVPVGVLSVLLSSLVSLSSSLSRS